MNFGIDHTATHADIMNCHISKSWPHLEFRWYIDVLKILYSDNIDYKFEKELKLWMDKDCK